MTQKTIEKFNQEISNLKKEMEILRSFLIGALAKDLEGDYRPDFVKKILQLSEKLKTSSKKSKKVHDFINL